MVTRQSNISRSFFTVEMCFPYVKHGRKLESQNGSAGAPPLVMEAWLTRKNTPSAHRLVCRILSLLIKRCEYVYGKLPEKLVASRMRFKVAQGPRV